MITDKTIPTLDPDLLEKLEQAQDSGVYGYVLRHITKIQEERNASATKRKLLTPIQKRRLVARETIESSSQRNDERYHIHSVLAMCGLPYRRPSPKVNTYHREYGKNSLIVQSGFLKDPLTGIIKEQGLPYGPKARLLMLHICTLAIRQKTREIELADSLSGLIRDLGFSVTGGEKGTIRLFKEQLKRLAAARMIIGLWDGNHAKTISTQPIKSFDIWMSSDPDQPTLWTNSLTLDYDFFESLKQHALPVDIRAVSAFTNSAKQIDLFLWLAYRLNNLKKPYLFSWQLLIEQFGTDIKAKRNFRKAFKEDLQTILEVFPKLPATLSDEGLRLSPADPEKLFLLQNKTKARIK